MEESSTKITRKKYEKIEVLSDFEPRNYYVYVHRKKTTGSIFYIGKGVNDRWKSSYSRNRIWTHTAKKYGVTAEVIMDNLSEECALELERELILFYGRLMDGGCLVNLLSFGNESPGLRGINSPNADTKEYKFTNIFTLDEFIGQRVKFTESHGFRIDQVVTGEVLVLNGWTLSETLLHNNLHKLRNPRAGKNNGWYNSEVLHFFNMETEEEFIGDRIDFKRKTGFNAIQLLNNTVLTYNDWCLYENKHKWYSMHKDYRKYLFINRDGRHYYCTRSNFERETGVKVQGLFKQYNPNFTAHGWRVIK